MKKRAGFLFGCLLLAGSLWAAQSGSSEFLGAARSAEVRVNGALLGRGDPVPGPGLVTTTLKPAVLELDNGRMLRFAANSAAKLESDSPRGDVELTVLAGRVYFRGPRGEISSAGRGSRIRLSPAQEDETGLFLDADAEPAAGGSRREREARAAASR